MPPRRTILIFHQAALGDFVLTWPLAMALARVFAQSRVKYVTGVDKGRLAEEAIGVESISADDGWHALHGDAVEPNERVKRTLAATQLVVLFAQHEEPTFAANVSQHAGDVPLIVLNPNPPQDRHVWDHHLAQLAGDGRLRDYVRQMQSLIRTVGLTPRPPAAAGPPGETNARGAPGPPTPPAPILIHPGSGSPKKNWPADHYLEVITRLRDAGRRTAVLLGEVERDRMSPAVRTAFSTAAGETVEPPDLPALRRALIASAGLIGNDAGPTHLAAVLGVPTVALFGPASDPAQWHPVGPRGAVFPFDTRPSAVVAWMMSIT